MALVADKIGYTYGVGTRYESVALRGVSLTLGPGDLVVVVGSTGSGKSTLLRLLAGLLEPTSGVVTVDGIAPGDRSIRGRVGMVFQNPESQFFAESVLDDVAFGPRNLGHEDPHAAASTALVSVGLDPATFGGRSPFTLSGGEARRVAVAGVIALDPTYLLLDEPTAGLDRRGRDAVFDAIVRVRSTAGVLVVTHDPDQFFAHADRMIALSDGIQAFAGTPGDVVSGPGPYLSAGLKLPDVVVAQLLARERGAALETIQLDPVAAGRALAEARRRLA